MSELRLATIRSADLPAIAEIHTEAFRDSAITAFGSEAVRRYYAWLLDGPHDARLVGAWQGQTLVGFCAAGVFRGAMNGFLRANRGYLALQAVRHPRLLASSLVRDRIRTAVRITLRYSRVNRRTETIAPSFGVLSIATKSTVRGSGAGRALMVDAEQRARALGFAKMILTVHPDNGSAVRFYEQLGWSRVGSDMWSGAMEKCFSSEP